MLSALSVMANSKMVNHKMKFMLGAALIVVGAKMVHQSFSADTDNK